MVVNNVLSIGDRFSIMANGDLHVRDVGSEDSHKPLRCSTYNTLTNDTRTSAEAMLYVIGNNVQFCSRCRTFISLCNQPPKANSAFHPSEVGK